MVKMDPAKNGDSSNKANQSYHCCDRLHGNRKVAGSEVYHLSSWVDANRISWVLILPGSLMEKSSIAMRSRCMMACQ